MVKDAEDSQSRFSKAVELVVTQIPLGKVVSYGQVAAYVGVPRAARGVGWILRQAQDKLLPWWRVINNQGRISIKGNMWHDAVNQRELLRSEGVVVAEDFTLEIEKFRFKATRKQLEVWGLANDYLEIVWRKFGKG